MHLIDVRTKQEYLQNTIPDSINFPLSEIMSGKMPSISKTEKIGVFCQSGARAEMAKMILQQNGFENVENLGGVDSFA
jgi:phage shock protein E